MMSQGYVMLTKWRPTVDNRRARVEAAKAAKAAEISKPGKSQSAGRSTPTPSNMPSHSIPKTILETNSEPEPTTFVTRVLGGASAPTSSIDSADILASSLSAAAISPSARGVDSLRQASGAPHPSTPPRSLEGPTLTTAITPLRFSSAHVDPASISPSESSSHDGGRPKARKSHTLGPWPRSQTAMESNKITQVDARGMEALLKEELEGSVFEHAQFFNEFLEQNNAIQREVRDCILSSSEYSTGGSGLDYNADTGYWSLSDSITKQSNEKEVYTPLAAVLNVIGRATFDIYRRRCPDDTFRLEYRPFVDHSDNTTLWNSPSDAATKSDLLKSSVNEHRSHWANVETIVECKSRSDTNSVHQASLQLARYARPMFTHQMYRNRVLGFALCGSIVFFVCFDRSGMLHSPKIDLSTPDGANDFVHYIIALMTIPPEKFGYDTRYSIDYSSEPAKLLFAFPGHQPEVVNEILCQRKCICGRATCVCGLGDKVHKSIWRPEDRTDEGKTLAQFENVFAVCQMAAHSSGTYSTKLNYPEGLRPSPFAGYFSSTSSTGHSGLGQRTSGASSHSSTSGSNLGPIQRGIREKSDLLMPRGAPLLDAQTPLHLLLAMRDSLMGVMAFTEAGKIHCDISAFNLLLIDPKKHYGSQNWLGSPTAQAPPDVWMRTARDPHKEVGGHIQNSDNESPRLRHVKALNRGPYCVVHDTEFIIDEDRTQSQVHTVRTGTPAFISGQLLLSFLPGQQPIARSFIHDVEALFWVLIWILIRRPQNPAGPWVVNDTAKELMRKLSNNSKRELAQFKVSIFNEVPPGRFRKTILALENDWSKALAPVATKLGRFFYDSLYFDNEEDDAPESSVQLKNEYLDEQREKTFERLFGILDTGIADLRKTYPEPDLELLFL